MPKERTEIDEITHLIAVWIAKIGISNALSYYDINKASEGVCLQLLNLIYGYTLVDYKEQKKGIDLSDSNEFKIAYQVTSRTDFAKIKRTLELFYGSSLFKEFPSGVKFLILSNQKVRIGKLGSDLQDRFNAKLDILYPSDLIRAIKVVYRNDKPRFLLIKQLLNREFGKRENNELPQSLIVFPDFRDHVNHFKAVTQSTLSHPDSQLIDFPCLVDDLYTSTDKLTPELFKSTGFIVWGLSGCGKTMLGRYLTSLFLESTGCAIYLSAKYYESDLNTLIDKEVKAFGFSSGYEFFEVCRSLGERILITVDGLNECIKPKRLKLLAELKLIVDRYKCNYLITTQVLDDSVQNLDGAYIKVEQPTLATKQAIAAKFSDIGERLIPLLEIVTSSYEAEMIGEIGMQDLKLASQFTIFDLFVRKKLEHFCHGTQLILSRVAQFLSDKISFSLSIRQAEYLAGKCGLSFSLLEEGLKAGIIVKKISKISFAHEMLLNYFTADSISRFSKNSEEISLAIKSPKNRHNKLLVLGSIEGTEELVEVLNGIFDTNLIIAIQAGEAGEFCQKWAEGRFKNMLTQIGVEISNIQFEITKDRYWPVQFKSQTLCKWTSQDFAFISAIPILFYDGLFLEEVFELVYQMDVACSKRINNLMEEAKGMGISVNSSVFHAAYIGISSVKSAITQIFSIIRSGFAGFNKKNNVNADVVENLLQQKTLKNGQFYLLLLLCQYRKDAAKLLYPYILDSLENKWKFVPYNLKHQILDTVAIVCESTEQEQRLISILNKIHAEAQDPMISTSIFDALSSLGALADDINSYEESVTEQLRFLLTAPENEESYTATSGIFYSQFDHPYDYAFSNAIEKLSIEQKKDFYKMALRGPYSTFFTSSLISIASELLGEEIAPYLLKYASQVIEDSHSVQDSTAVLIISNILLGQLCFPIEGHHKEHDNESNNALLAGGEIYYWINRNDIDLSERKKMCGEALECLFGKFDKYAVEVVWECSHALSYLGQSQRYRTKAEILDNIFPEYVVKCCRLAIAQPNEQKSLHSFHRTQEIIQHAISLLAEYGNATDIILLKTLSEDDQLGHIAVDAIKKLEST